MKIKILCCFIVFTISIWQCDQFAENKVIVGQYRLIATDVLENMSLAYESGEIVNATVFAYGFNKEYIILKQHPRKWPDAPDKTITNYFIVPIDTTIKLSRNVKVLGPLSHQKFVVKLDSLNITNKIKFTKIYKSLE